MVHMRLLAECEVTIHSTKDKKKLKGGEKEYIYGTINIRDPKLTPHVGKRVKVIVKEIEKKR